jgi:dolichol-phosphate mannosyltransferase
LRELKVVVVVPTYNERDNLAPFVERLTKASASIEAELHLLFVDDGSPDGTGKEVEALAKRNASVHLLERGEKRGIGTAYQDGFRHAIETLTPTVFVQMDADLQHPPEKVGPLVRAVEEGADVAVGSRYVKGGGFRGLTRWRRLVSWGANWLARHLLGLSVHDTTSGFKALDRAAVDTLLGAELYSKGFIFQVESLFLFKRHGLRAVEVPYVFEERSKGASKMSGGEIWEFLRSVLMMRFRSYGKKA